jgi:hypothetical protein
MNASKIVVRALASFSLVGLLASQASATCDTGKLTFPAKDRIQIKKLSCSGANSKHSAENIGGTKRVFATLNVGKRSARTNGITSSNRPISECFAQDNTAGSGTARDLDGCQQAAFWIGTLFT